MACFADKQKDVKARQAAGGGEKKEGISVIDRTMLYLDILKDLLKMFGTGTTYYAVSHRYKDCSRRWLPLTTF